MKSYKNLFFILILFSTFASIKAEVRLVLSAALTDSYFEFRKKQYIKALNIYSQCGYKNPYIIEAVKKDGPTFLDNYSTHVFYSKANIPQLANKGINENLTLLDGMAHFNFAPDDMIIKITGRYHLLSDYFLRTVEKNQDYDAIVKIDKSGHLRTLCFAMKYKFLKEMYESLDYKSLERNLISVEVVCGEYITKKIKDGTLKVLLLDTLGIRAFVHGSSTAPDNSLSPKFVPVSIFKNYITHNHKVYLGKIIID